MSDELHISSLIVHAKTALKDRVAADIARLPGAEIHAVGEQGKIIVTLETPSEAGVTDSIDCINRIDGVLSALLVYHHSESRDSLEEFIHENHAS